jgi:hypothetical protein
MNASAAFKTEDNFKTGAPSSESGESGVVLVERKKEEIKFTRLH